MPSSQFKNSAFHIMAHVCRLCSWAKINSKYLYKRQKEERSKHSCVLHSLKLSAEQGNILTYPCFHKTSKTHNSTQISVTKGLAHATELRANWFLFTESVWVKAKERHFLHNMFKSVNMVKRVITLAEIFPLCKIFHVKILFYIFINRRPLVKINIYLFWRNRSKLPLSLSSVKVKDLKDDGNVKNPNKKKKRNKLQSLLNKKTVITLWLQYLCFFM